MKILFYASYPTLTVGYAKIGNILSNYLASLPREIVSEVYYFGISKFKDNPTCEERPIHPRIKFIDVLDEELKIGSSEIYGVDIIDEWIRKIKPDVFIIYNDIIVTCRLLNSLLKFRQENKDKTKFICYIDLVYPYEKLEYIHHMDRNCDMILVFSDCWKRNLVEMGVNENKIKILNHGITENNYIFEMDKTKARRILDVTGKVISDDDFLILNTNRNSYRKAIDVTIASFILFLKVNNMNPKIKLYLNCALDSTNGYDIINVIKTECIREGISYDSLIQNNHILTSSRVPGSISDEMVNVLYNASDVGINTCVGEGFGLCNVEHAFLKRPQIVPNVGAFEDIFKKNSLFKLVEPVCSIAVSNHTDCHVGYISLCKKEDYVSILELYFREHCKKTNFLNEISNKAHLYIKRNYNWDKILSEQFLPIVKELKDEINTFSSSATVEEERQR